MKLLGQSKKDGNRVKKIARFFKSKYFLAVICLILAGTISFGGLPLIYADRDNTMMIVRAVKTIPEGKKITEEYLQNIEVGKYNLPSNVILSQDEVIGKYAKDTIYGGDYLTSEKLNDVVGNKLMTDAMLSGKKLVTITLLSQASGGANIIKPNDIVSVAKYTDEMGVVLIPELQNIRVYDLTSEQNISNTGQDEFIPKTITLVVDNMQAAKLLSGEYEGKIHIIFERRGE